MESGKPGVSPGGFEEVRGTKKDSRKDMERGFRKPRAV